VPATSYKESAAGVIDVFRMFAAALAASSAAVGGGCTFNQSAYGPGEAEFSHRVHVFVETVHGGGTRTRRSTWGSAAAQEALDFLHFYVTFEGDPPAPRYVSEFADPAVYGVFTGTEIFLRNDLDPNTERWVALHESTAPHCSISVDCPTTHLDPCISQYSTGPDLAAAMAQRSRPTRRKFTTTTFATALRRCKYQIRTG